MPSAQGAASSVLTNDGSGVLSWAAPAATGANTALSNLAAVAINTSLLPGVTNSISVGSSSFDFASGNIRVLNDSSAVASVDTQNRFLKDSSGNISVRYDSRAMYDNSVVLSIDWQGRQLRDDTNAVSVKYNDRSLNSPDTSAKLTWTNTGIGIGMTSPSTILEVAGTLSLDGSTSGVLGIKAANTTTSHTLTMPSAQGGAATYLGNDGSGNLSWSSPSGTQSVTSTKTGTYSVLTSDENVPVDATSASFTATLYTAVGNTGKIVTFIRTDQTLANAVTLATTGGQTIRGQSTFKLTTQNESVTVISDGSNWLVKDHQFYSGLISAGTNTVTATGSNPTKPSMTTDTLKWRRVGDSMEVHIVMLSSATSGTPGTGDYLFQIPTGVTIDTSKAYVDTHTGAGAPDWPATVGSAACAFQGTSNASGTVRCYDTTRVRLYSFGGNLPVGPANGYGWGSQPMMYSATFVVPITGWEG